VASIGVQRDSLRVTGASRTWLTIEALVAAGADQVTVLAGAPDLPGLLVGKLHRARSADVAVPGSDGGLVGLASMPPPDWLAAESTAVTSTTPPGRPLAESRAAPHRRVGRTGLAPSDGG
jgi:hypothetical protein